MKRFRWWLVLAALVAAPALWAQVTVAGVKYEDGIELGSSKLSLQGAGIRTKLFFKVYTAGLYLPRKAGTADEVLALPGPKRVSLTMLREIDSAEFGQAFAKGIEDNNDQATLARVAASVQRLNQIFAAHQKLGPGDGVIMDWVPATGTVIRVRGAAQGEPLADPEFYTALLRIWLGPKPVDGSLKAALLGKAD